MPGGSRVFAVLVCAALTPCVVLAAPSAAESAKTQQRAAPQRQSVPNPSGKPPPRISAGTPSLIQNRAYASAVPQRAADDQSRAVMVAPNPPQNKHATTASHTILTMTNTRVVAGLPDSAMGRHTAGATVVGGPSKFDVRNGAVINGSQIWRRP